MQRTTDDHIYLKPSELVEALAVAMDANTPVCIHGLPGIGKSAIVQQVADGSATVTGYMSPARLAGLKPRKVFEIRGSYREPSDIIGLPSVVGGRTVFNAPDFLPAETFGPCIIFLDELNRATPMMQNTLLGLVQERQVAGVRLPPEARIIAAVNDSDAGVQRMSGALLDRFIHLWVEPDVNDFRKYALASGFHPAVIGFVGFRPDLLHDWDPKAVACPTPRKWEIVSDITLQAPPDTLASALYEGCVGRGTAIEYQAFLRIYRSLPKMESILLNPTSTPVPTDPAVLFALSSALARVAKTSNFGRLIQYAQRMPAEFNVFAVKAAEHRDKALSATPEFTAWAINNADVVF